MQAINVLSLLCKTIVLDDLIFPIYLAKKSIPDTCFISPFISVIKQAIGSATFARGAESTFYPEESSR